MSNLSQFLSGGIKSIQRGTITMPAATPTATVTISSVNPAKTELRFLGYIAPGATTNRGQDMARVELTNATTISVYRGSSAGVALTLGWELTERY